MKQINKKFYLGVGILAIVGIAFIILGLLFGASTSIYVDKEGFHFGKVKNDPYEETYSFKRIEKLELDVAFSEVQVIKSDRNEVQISGNGKTSKPKVKMEHDTLKISSQVQINFFLGIFKQGNQESNITIYVKEDLKDCELEISYSDLKLKKVAIEEFTLDTSFSSVDMEGEYQKIKVNNNFGDVKGVVSSVNELKLENDFGSITLGMTGSFQDYNLRYENDFGEIKINGKEIKKVKEPYGNKKIKLNNSFGDISLEF